MDAPAGELSTASEQPPEGTHANAGAAANLRVPPGATRADLVLGEQVFHGRVGGAGCVGCHGSDGGGTPVGPSLLGPTWLWSDGSVSGLEQTIREGVTTPKQYRDPMPPMGGAQLADAQVRALAVYVWALGHH